MKAQADVPLQGRLVAEEIESVESECTEFENHQWKTKDGSISEVVCECGAESEVVSRVEGDNLVVGVGAERLATLFDSGSATTFDYMAIGSDGTAASESDTQLVAEEDRSSAITTSIEAFNGYNRAVRYDFTFSQGAGKGSIEEVGLFDNSSANSGTMFNRFVFSTPRDNENNDLRIQLDVRFAP